MGRHALEAHKHENIEYYFKNPNPNDNDLLPNVGDDINPPVKRKEIELTSDSITFLEGTNMTPQVKLSVKPDSDVTISVSNSNLEIGVTPKTLTFTPANFSTYQPLSIQGNRGESAGDLEGIVTLSPSGGGYDGVVSKQINIKMISEGGELPPPSGEFAAISQKDIKCVNGTVAVSSGDVTLQSASGYAMVHTQSGIIGFEGVLEYGESHIVIAATEDGTSVVSAYFKTTSGMLFKTVNGSASACGNLSNCPNNAIEVGDTLKITPVKNDSDKVEIHYKDSVQTQISLSELEQKSGISNLRFAFGIISQSPSLLFSGARVLGVSDG
ncbi:MAG: hypothetical protein ACRCX2_23990, partial [Paraclostridium sp.]